MKKAPRSEAEVFAELADLASSEGYVHAIALICCRDNLIPYVDDLKASDLQKLYRRDRLIRTEITTLLGLLARRTITTVNCEKTSLAPSRAPTIRRTCVPTR